MKDLLNLKFEWPWPHWTVPTHAATKARTRPRAPTSRDHTHREQLERLACNLWLFNLFLACSLVAACIPTACAVILGVKLRPVGSGVVLHGGEWGGTLPGFCSPILSSIHQLPVGGFSLEKQIWLPERSAHCLCPQELQRKPGRVVGHALLLHIRCTRKLVLTQAA